MHRRGRNDGKPLAEPRRLPEHIVPRGPYHLCARECAGEEPAFVLLHGFPDDQHLHDPTRSRTCLTPGGGLRLPRLGGSDKARRQPVHGHQPGLGREAATSHRFWRPMFRSWLPGVDVDD